MGDIADVPGYALAGMLPENKYRALLGEYSNVEGMGLLRWDMASEHRAAIYTFFGPYHRPLWFSELFYMPSLCWRGLRMQTAQDAPELRWAVALLVFERQGCTRQFPWQLSGPEPPKAEAASGLTGEVILGGGLTCEERQRRYPGDPGRPGRFIGLVHLNPEVLRHQARATSRKRLGCITEAHLGLPNAVRRGNWHVCQNVAGTAYGMPGFQAVSALFSSSATPSWVGCAFYAVQSALMMLSDRIGCRPLGTLDLVRHTLAAVCAEMTAETGQLSTDDRERLAKIQHQLQSPSREKWSEHGALEEVGSVFDLLAKGVRHDPWSARQCSDGNLPPSVGADLFDAEAFTETISFSIQAERDIASVEWAEDAAGAQEFWERLVDYLSDGFPVVLAAEGKRLPEYQKLKRSLKANLRGCGCTPDEGKPDTAEQEAPPPHAFFVYGFHLTQPNDLSADERMGAAGAVVTRFQQVDKFLLSDLAWFPLIEVGAPYLFRSALSKPSDSPGSDLRYALRFMVILPKGVARSLGDARKRALGEVVGLLNSKDGDKLPDAIQRAFAESSEPRHAADHSKHYLLRAALYEKQAAWYRFERALGKGEREALGQGGERDREALWKALSLPDGEGADAGPARARQFWRGRPSRHVWALEFHPVHADNAHGPFSAQDPLPGDQQSCPYLVVLLDGGESQRSATWDAVAVILPRAAREGGTGLIRIGAQPAEEGVEFRRFDWEEVYRV